MNEAKGVEIKEWIPSKVCQAAVGRIPPSRLMRMGWVLVFKPTDDPKTMKAKARLVVLGYTDPDVGYVNTKSPTLSLAKDEVPLQRFKTSPQLFTLAENEEAYRLAHAARRSDSPVSRWEQGQWNWLVWHLLVI